MLTKEKNSSDVNIRGTTDAQFWGRSFADSVYLWEWAKHNLTLRQMADVAVPTLPDCFAGTQQVNKAHEFARATFYKYLPRLSAKLNELHKLEMPDVFWRVVFGYWLYRHICIVYDKYRSLEQLDLDRTDVKLLHRSSFYVPNDHFDHLHYYCNDMGVMQLVTEYYDLFATRKFDRLESSWPGLVEVNPDANLIIRAVAVVSWSLPRGNIREVAERRLRSLKKAVGRWLMEKRAEINRNSQCTVDKGPKIGLSNVFYTQAILSELFEESGGAIGPVQLPTVSTITKPVNRRARSWVSRLPAESRFEEYLAETLQYALPKILVEYFSEYYEKYSRHIESIRCTHIVTEAWLSYMPLSIYLAVARRNKGVKLILQQHGASLQWHNCCLNWLDIEVADMFLTTGWRDSLGKVVPGGFAIRQHIPYRFDALKTDVLHVCTTMFHYPYEFGDGSTGFLEYLKRTNELIGMIPARLRPHYVLRPRRVNLFWDTEKSWEVQEKGIRLDPEPEMSKSIQNARLIIIDHLSTGIAEILMNRIPFLLMHYEDFEPLSAEYPDLFRDLIQCGVVHETPQSGMRQLEKIYDDVESWWTSAPVQKAVNEIAHRFLGPPSRTVDCLLSLLNSKEADRCRVG